MFTRPASAAYNPPPAVVNNTPTVDPGIHSLADLVNVSTVNLVCPVLKNWVNYADGTFQAWTLLPIDGGTRPADFNATSNLKSWFKAST
jgi:hypothetical protein